MIRMDSTMSKKLERLRKYRLFPKKWCCSFVKWMLAMGLTLLCFCNGIGAVPAAGYAVSNADTVDKQLTEILTKTRIEQEFDQKIREQLSTIIKENRFVVNSSVDISLAYLRDETIRREGDQQFENLRNQELPGTPSLPGFLLFKGLNTTSVSGGSYSSANSSMFIVIKQINVELLINQDYTAEERDFIRRLIQTAVKMNTERGDAVRINQIAFPENEEQTISISDSLNKLTVEEGESDKAAFSFLQKNPIWATLSGLLLMGLILISYFLFRKKGEQEVPEKESIAMMRNQNYQPEQDTGAPAYATEAVQVEKVREPVGAFTELVKKNPCDMARFIEYEYRLHKEPTLQVLLTVDKKLIVAMKPYVSEEFYKILTNELFASDDTRYNVEAVQYFLDEIEKRINRDALVYKFLPNQTFSFINLLPIKHLVKLVQDLKPFSAAVILGHLDLKMFNKISEHLSVDHIAEIWQYLPMVHSINLESYEDLSGKIFKKSRKLLTKKNLPKLQLISLAEALEQTESSKKDLIMHNLKKKGSEFSSTILDQVVSVEDLFEMDAEVISELLSDFEPKEVAVICSVIDPEQAAIILKMRGDREKLLTDSYLTREISKQDQKIVQAKLLRRMKESSYFRNKNENEQD